jgi:hypothetical protein
MTDDRVIGALAFIQERVDQLMADVAAQKKLANSLAQAAGMPAVYDDIQETGAAQGQGLIRPDQFANHSAPSTAARAYLETRKAQGAATIDAIYDAMVKGGYGFGTTNVTDAKNGLRIALGKDAHVHRLPNGHYGLREWYPNAGIKRDKPKKAGEPDPTEEPPKVADVAVAEEGPDESDPFA